MSRLLSGLGLHRALYRSTRQETALFVFPYNIHLRDEIFSFLYHFYIKEFWYNISCMDSSNMYKNGLVTSSNPKKCVSPRRNLPIIALNGWASCPDSDLNC